MVEFVSISAHVAVVYLHALLARHQFARRTESFSLYMFWVMMLMYAVMHASYAVKILAGELDLVAVRYWADLTGVLILSYTPPTLVAVLFDGMTVLPRPANPIARLLGIIGRNLHASTATAFAIATVFVGLYLADVQTLEEYAGDVTSLDTMWFAIAFGLVWAAAWLSGLRYTEAANLGQAIGILFMVLIVFYLASSYLIDIGPYWSLVPLVSTIAFSLVFAWYRFRFQFIDIVLRRLVQFLIALAGVALSGALVSALTAQPPSIRLLVLFACVLLTGLAVWGATRALARLWSPSSGDLVALYNALPVALAGSATPEAAIAVAERELSRTFRADVGINKALPGTCERLDVGEGHPVTMHLGYIRGWMPWLSENLAAVRTAGLYLQNHLQTLATLALSELAARAELAAMHARIRPHFLFNTLNTIHGFVRDDPAAAERTIELLADLMRGAAQGVGDLYPLERELALTRAYLEIERLRHGERLRFDVDVSPELGAHARGAASVDSATAHLPPFSIQPLVENAVKFALESARGTAVIGVRCEARAGNLVVTVSDNGPGLGHTHNAGLGTALANIRERLARLFGERAALTLANRASGGVDACLTIPLDSTR